MTKEIPLLMSGPLVRATLAGLKTQTRRPIKRENKPDPGFEWAECLCREIDPSDTPCCTCEARFPGIASAGDRLWVRETWMPDAPRNGEWPDVEFYGCGMSPRSLIPECYRHPWHVLHRATYEGCELVGWKPSIHMPRWASRITLEVTAIRVERLQDISEADAKAEGASYHNGLGVGHSGWRHDDGAVHNDARSAYAQLWNSINGPGSWDANPWVWVVEFALTTTSKGGAE